MFSTNTTLASVARGDTSNGIDKYGRKTTTNVYETIRVWIDQDLSFSRDGEGDSTNIDGRLIVDAYYELKTGDIITVSNDNSDKFLVKNESEGQDITGSVISRTYTLTRQR